MSTKYTKIKRYRKGKGNQGKTKGAKFLTKKDLWLYHFTNIDNKKTFLHRTNSAEAAGYRARNEDEIKRRQTFAEIGSQNFRRFKKEINKWLDEFGLSTESLKAKLLEMMNAKEKKFFTSRGVIVSTRKVPALEIQRKSLDMALKVKGEYQPKVIELVNKKDKKRKKKLRKLDRRELEAIKEIMEG